MTILSHQAETRLCREFRTFNRGMLLVWRLGLGAWLNSWPAHGGRIMVLVHRGRKTGLQRRTPVNYTIQDGDIYCTAGFGTKTDWYLNVLADPRVEVWLPDGWWEGVAEDISSTPDRLPLLRQVLIASGFAARIFGFNPQSMPDELLDQATQSYRLIRIHRTAPRTGPGGPGDLSWLWPVATFFLLLSKIRKPKQK